jgi:hypothetical protein
VHTSHGVQEKTVIHVPGDPQLPFDEGAVCDKFRRVTDRLDPSRAAHLLEQCGTAFETPHWPADLIAEIAQAEELGPAQPDSL